MGVGGIFWGVMDEDFRWFWHMNGRIFRLKFLLYIE